LLRTLQRLFLIRNFAAMQNLFRFVSIGFFLIFISCHSENTGSLVNNNTVDTVNIFPVTDFLKAQLKKIDSMPVTPLKIITENGKIDSVWMKREDIRTNADAFLSPVIDSANMTSLFSEKAFLDETINEFTFSYDAKKNLPDSIHLTHWDVYLNPQTKDIDRIYLVKENNDSNANVTKQLTWVTNKWFSIRTITQLPDEQPKIKEEKMIWDFDD
jgi:hypothetical protein